jgi:polyferredoxin
MAAYSVVLAALLGLFSFLLATRTDVEATIMRVPGMLYQEQENNRISNLYNIQFINKTFDDVNLHLRLKGQADGTIKRVGEQALVIPATGNLGSVYFIELPKEVITGITTKLVIEVYKDDQLIDEIKTNFLGPVTN